MDKFNLLNKVGINTEGAQQPLKQLDQERNNLFKFFATGRVNASYCIVSIETKRRQV